MKSRTGQRLDAVAGALRHVDYFFANLEEASFLTGREKLEEIARVLLDAGVKHLLVKDGRHGCYIWDGSAEEHIPAFCNDHPVDTIWARPAPPTGCAAGSRWRSFCGHRVRNSKRFGVWLFAKLQTIFTADTTVC